MKRYERLAKQAEANMLEGHEMSDAERIGRMLKFTCCEVLSLACTLPRCTSRGISTLFVRNAVDIENADFSAVFDDDEDAPKN